jgi:hypothetical protein
VITSKIDAVKDFVSAVFNMKEGANLPTPRFNQSPIMGFDFNAPVVVDRYDLQSFDPSARVHEEPHSKL